MVGEDDIMMLNLCVTTQYLNSSKYTKTPENQEVFGGGVFNFKCLLK